MMRSESSLQSSRVNTMTSALTTPVLKPTAVRNVLNVVLGDILFKAWYPSFYSEELVGREVERLFVCQWCFKYSKEILPFLAHVKLCTAKDQEPPGRLIYRKEPYSIHEVDGEDYKLFTQNLSLFAKLFLDNKSVFFDVTSFNYYLLVQHSSPDNSSSSPSRPRIIGFFSKEKMSWDNNNVACILVFPPWQRKGLGKILMGVSYELSRREGRIGGPEKPLSDLGRKGYLRFWEVRVARSILSMKNKSNATLGEIAESCWMLIDDVILALKEMEIVAVRKKGDRSAVVSKVKIREWASVKGVDMTPPIDEDCFVDEWIPEMPDVEE